MRHATVEGNNNVPSHFWVYHRHRRSVGALLWICCSPGVYNPSVKLFFRKTQISLYFSRIIFGGEKHGRHIRSSSSRYRSGVYRHHTVEATARKGMDGYIQRFKTHWKRIQRKSLPQNSLFSTPGFVEGIINLWGFRKLRWVLFKHQNEREGHKVLS